MGLCLCTPQNWVVSFWFLCKSKNHTRGVLGLWAFVGDAAAFHQASRYLKPLVSMIRRWCPGVFPPNANPKGSTILRARLQWYSSRFTPQLNMEPKPDHSFGSIIIWNPVPFIGHCSSMFTRLAPYSVNIGNERREHRRTSQVPIESRAFSGSWR